MRKTERTIKMYIPVIVASLIVLVSCFCCSKKSEQPAWKSANDDIVRQYGIRERIRTDIPDTKIIPNLQPGVIASLKNLPETEIASGVKARMYWSRGALVSWMTFSPGAEIPREKLTGERIMVVMKGSVEQLINGANVTMRAHGSERMTPISGYRELNEFVYLEKGAENAVKAGSEGAEILDVSCPVRPDYLKKAGVRKVPSTVSAGGFIAAPTIAPGKVYDLYNVQFTEIAPKANTRLIAGKGVQLSFLRMDPNTAFARENQPEEHLMIVLRGSIDEILLDSVDQMQAGDVAYIPSGMVYGGSTGPYGCDVLDVFWPVRSDYTEIMARKLAEYHAVIPEDSEIELVVDGAKKGPGLCYCEGPSWINGKLYFSSMGYDDKWNGFPDKSATVEMDPDGTYRYIATGMETNGTFPLGNGNMAVCDMFGHRVIEMSTKGNVVRTLADRYNGVRIDGPNDLAVDDKGGIYFTDPQILPKPFMQPGRSVFYRKPDGKVIRVIEPGTLEKPNGLILSPDCRILYVNSTPDNFIMAYDINADGSLSNGRKFCDLYVTPEVLDAKSVNPQVDGMTMDELGNVYITSIIGLQIIKPDGDMLGYIHFPLMPVNCCFGDEDGKTLYVLCNDKVYRIRTNVRGAAYTLKR
ncbi:SMP-30/gluconolactonase/LRE family protein [bacterium]|nr:SMP-30/gluconolactonase/LRE family protein [bacterium]